MQVKGTSGSITVRDWVRYIDETEYKILLEGGFKVNWYTNDANSRICGTNVE
jgi:hypothetical protein